MWVWWFHIKSQMFSRTQHGAGNACNNFCWLILRADGCVSQWMFSLSRSVSLSLSFRSIAMRSIKFHQLKIWCARFFRQSNYKFTLSNGTVRHGISLRISLIFFLFNAHTDIWISSKITRKSLYQLHSMDEIGYVLACYAIQIADTNAERIHLHLIGNFRILCHFISIQVIHASFVCIMWWYFQVHNFRLKFDKFFCDFSSIFFFYFYSLFKSSFFIQITFVWSISLVTFSLIRTKKEETYWVIWVKWALS